MEEPLYGREAGRPSRSADFLRASAIVLCTFWVFAPAIRGTRLWDDNLEITEATALRTPGGLARIWLGQAGWDYFPLKTSLQWVQWHLWGDSPAGYHLTNIALHTLGALLLWRLMKRLGTPCAWWAGVVFAVHPMAVESVAWIAEFKNALSLPLVLLAMGAYLRYDAGGRGSGRRLALSVLLFFAAILSKSSVAMFPFVLLLYAWWKRGRIAARDLRSAAPFFAVSLALGLVTVWFQHSRAIGGEYIPLGGAISRIAGAGLAAAFYLEQVAFPLGVMPIYPRWDIDPPSLAQFLPWAGFAAAAAWLWARRHSPAGRAAAFGLGVFLVNLGPVLGFIPMAYSRISLVADHLAYLSVAAAAGLAAAALGAAEAWLKNRGLRLHSIACSGLAGAACLGLAWESRAYAASFSSEAASVTYALRCNPGSWFAHFRMGNLLREAVKIFPGAIEARSNLGNVLFGQRGRAEEAVAEYEQALRIFPQSAEVHCNLGNLLFEAGRHREAAAQFKEAVRLLPSYAAAHNGLAMALGEAGQLDEALLHSRVALRLDPDFAEARNNLANTLLRLGRADEAIAQYREALRLKPGFAQACGNLGVALGIAGRLPEAIAVLERAQRLNPADEGVRRNLEAVRARAGAQAGPQ